MGNHISKSTAELAALVSGTLIGSGDVLIKRVASLETAAENEIAYLEDEKYLSVAAGSKASCLIVPSGTTLTNSCRIEVKRPKLAFALIAEVLHPPKQRVASIHPSADVAESA